MPSIQVADYSIDTPASGPPGPVAALVTGAAGFIGSHLVDRLLADGHRVIGIDDFDPSYDPATKWANLAQARRNPRFTLIEGDLTGADGLHHHLGHHHLERHHLGRHHLGHPRLVDLFGDVSVVFHLAGRPGVQDSWGSGFGAYAERNIHATQQVYEAALAAGVSRVVYASSSSVYGARSADGGDRAAAPVSPYGVSKLAGEHLAGAYRARGLAVTSLRYFTVYGPRQRPDMAMHRLFRASMAGGPPFQLRGDGHQHREFTHVDDVVAATVAAGWRAEADAATIDIGGGTSVGLTDVIERVEDLVGAPVRLRQLPQAAGDPAATTADNRPASRLLGWAPTVNLDTGLASQLAWHRLQHCHGQAEVSSATGSSSASASASASEAEPEAEGQLLVAD